MMLFTKKKKAQNKSYISFCCFKAEVYFLWKMGYFKD